MNDFLAGAAVFCISSVVWIYSILTYPIYGIIQQPWKLKRAIKKSRAYQVKDSEGLCYRKLCEPSPLQLEMQKLELDTMAKVLDYACKKYSKRKALGSRTILGESEEKQKNGKVFKKYDMGDYNWLTFAELHSQAIKFGRGLREIGLKPKDRVLIYADTRSEWLISAMGAFQQSMAICTLYASLGEEGLMHGINQTEVTTVVTAPELLGKLKKLLSSCSQVVRIIYFKDPLNTTNVTGFDSVSLFTYEEIVERGAHSKFVESPPSPEDTAIIMYTSGSTGVPKGVVLSHCNITYAMMQFAPVMQAFDDDIYLAFLPLAHVLELLGESLMLLYGVSMGYSTPLTLTDVSTKVKKGCPGDATVLKPTCLPAVPLILDRIYKAAIDKVSSNGVFSKKLFLFFVKYRITWIKRGWDTPICNRLIFKRLRSLLGGRMRNMGCGGAPLSPNTHDFTRAIMGVNVCQGYGLTETCGTATMMDQEDDYTTGRVGAPLSMCDIKLVDWEEGGYTIHDLPNPRGEIIIGGKNVAVGYFKNPEKTEESFYELDGKRWFRSGDIGEMFPNGTLKIIDRKKDLVKLQMGEYVSLGKVESLLKLSPYVENICVCADSTKNRIVTIISPDAVAMRKLGDKLGKSSDVDVLYNDDEVKKEVLSNLTQVGTRGKLEKFEIPVACYLTTEVWSSDNKMLTATMKLSRKNIEAYYQEEIQKMFKSL